MRVCVQMLPTAFSISLLRALPFAQGVWVLGRWCLSPAAAEQQARGSHLGTWLCGQSRLELEAGWPVCAHDRRRLGRGVGALAPLAFLVFCPCPTTILLHLFIAQLSIQKLSKSFEAVQCTVDFLLSLLL
jgi:hypothetical protein